MSGFERGIPRKRVGLAVLLGTAAVAVVPQVAFGGGAESSSTHTVVLKEKRFHPGALNINRGDSVKWIWRDGGTEHNVTFPHSSHSRTQTSGSYTLRFVRSGTFNYDCTIHVHEGMRGKIVVR